MERELVRTILTAFQPPPEDSRMHELSIASSILDAVKAEAERRPGTRILKVGVRVGELAGVDPEALSFCFESIVQGTALAPLGLEIEHRPHQNRCPHCARVFQVVDYEVACPACGTRNTDMISGDELELAYLEVEGP